MAADNSTGDFHHRQSDLQSLLLNRAALKIVADRPETIERILRTLDHWDLVAPVSSKSLRDAWRAMAMKRDFTDALAENDRGQELRQASPLCGVLDPAKRLRIIKACKGTNSST